MEWMVPASHEYMSTVIAEKGPVRQRKTIKTAEDVLIMTDPYDTTDHFQDGYVIVPLERFFL